MREILFRGKRLSDGEWVYGGFAPHIKDKDRCFIVSMSKDHISDIGWHQEVDPETVGQFSGLMDKNEVKIFEGDKLRCSYGNGYKNFVKPIIWHNSGWWIESSKYDFFLPNKEHREVIGNIHDNPKGE